MRDQALSPYRIHELKVWPEYFRAMDTQEKTFEVRRFDRDLRVGDFLRLMEWDPVSEDYSEKCLIARITYILNDGQFGVSHGYCVLGLDLSPRIASLAADIKTAHPPVAGEP